LWLLLQGEPWVRLVVTGQSFMLHQIRKMVGVALAVMRGVASPNAVPLALDPRRDVSTPMAPDVGLFLDEGIFEGYNARWGDVRDDRVSLEPYAADIERFKVGTSLCMFWTRSTMRCLSFVNTLLICSRVDVLCTCTVVLPIRASIGA